MEQVDAMQNENIITLILLQKQLINSLEVECNKIYPLSLSLFVCNNLGSGNSLQERMREEEIVCQKKNPMEIKDQVPLT
jgi:hypothetical protein